MSAALALLVTLTSIDCGSCGGTYAINERYRAKRQEVGGFWHCPYCQVEWGFAKDGTELAKAQRELQAERARKQAALDRANIAEQMRLKAERKLKRVEKGTCPCCKRSFVDLRRHIATKHPEGVTN